MGLKRYVVRSRRSLNEVRSALFREERGVIVSQLDSGLSELELKIAQTHPAALRAIAEHHRAKAPKKVEGQRCVMRDRADQLDSFAREVEL